MSVDTPPGDPVRLKPGSRPEVEVLASAIASPLVLASTASDAIRYEFALLPIGHARDLLDLIEDLCPTHVRCATCGDRVACKVCNIGNLADWCPHALICAECRFVDCIACIREAGH